MARYRRELRPLIQAAGEQGWRVERTRGSHYRFVPPDPSRSMVVASSTPSDPATMDALKAELRRSGLRLPR